MRFERFEVMGGDEVAINPAQVAAVTPAVDPKTGRHLLGMAVVQLAAGPAFLVKSPMGEVVQRLEGPAARVAL